MERLFWICLAGAVGTGARYAMALWAAQRFGSAFPYGTLVVNLIGCFIIAALMHAAVGLDWSPTTRAALTIGFIGGFTTYSSFNYETMRLVEEGALGAAALNTALTVFGGWTSGLLGLITARLDALAAASGRAKSNLSAPSTRWRATAWYGWRKAKAAKSNRS